jgi:hypothetical protein
MLGNRPCQKHLVTHTMPPVATMPAILPLQPRGSLNRPSTPSRLATLASLLALGLAFADLPSLLAADRPAQANPSTRSSLLFPTDGIPPNWLVRSWNDVTLPAPTSANWRVSDGVLQGSVPRGTWLLSPGEYGDFVLEFEARVGERGRGGVGLRLPLRGNPAAEAFELPIVDPQYFGTNYTPQPWENNGALYQAVAPTSNPFKPLEWNRYRIECRGPRITVTLNGTRVIDVPLTQPNPDQNTDTTPSPVRGKALADRPLRGRIGFLEVSRGTAKVEFRDAKIRELHENREPR